MPEGVWILYLILAAGIIGQNPLVITAAAILLAMVTLNLHAWVPVVERHSINIGLTLLIVGLLTPFAGDRLTFRDVAVGLRGATGLAAVVGGALAAYMCARGLELLAVEPHVIIGLIVGTIIGVAFFRGVPVGPLAAAGLAALFLRALGQGKGAP